MRKVLLGLLLVSGCYGAVGVHGGFGYRGPNLVNAVATAIVVGAVINAVASAPPVVADVEYYDYGYNPGNVWVNGRYTYVNNNWAWQRGYWQQERPGQYWIQGSWQPRGNQYVWTDGYWAAPRQGYTYIDGYWDYRDTGYVWQQGSWEQERPGYVYTSGTWSNYNGRRTWQRGGWQYDDGRPDYARYRVRGRATMSGGVRVH